MKTIPNLPEKGDLKRVVIIGGGFGGLKLARTLDRKHFQIILLDKDNYHLFQPLMYQVAITGLEVTSIAYPFRKMFQNHKNIYFRLCTVQDVDPDRKRVITDIGELTYDYLVVATGCGTNYFGNEALRDKAMALKSATESLDTRNRILQSLETASVTDDIGEKSELMNFVIVGGGATGVELAGALADMKHYVLKKDYPELDFNDMHIHLVDANERLLTGMSESASKNIRLSLLEMGVELHQAVQVNGYENNIVTMNDGTEIRSRNVLWVAGITGNRVGGFTPEAFARGSRFNVDNMCRVWGQSDIFAIGDVAYMETGDYPKGHPQVAQVAIQMGKLVAENLKAEVTGAQQRSFHYKNKGSLATIGRNSGVADFGKMHFHGRIAWWLWLVVHLFTIIGVKNRLVILLNWGWNYLTFDSSLRVIIKGRKA